MNPVRGDVHVDAPLTNISIAQMNDPSNFVATQAFPRVPVVKESDKYFIYTASQMFRSHTEVRAPGDPVAMRDHTLSTATYTADEYAVGELVPDRIAENADSPLDMYNDSAMICTQDIQMFTEDNWADVALVTSAWTNETTLSGTNQWSDYVNSDPIGDIDTGKETISGATGLSEDMLSIVMGREVFNKLKRHPDILAQFGGGTTVKTLVKPADLAEILGVKEVLIGNSVWNTNREGNSTQTLTRIIGKLCLIYYRPDSPGLRRPSAGYFFAKKVAEAYRWRSNRRRSEVIEVCSLFDFKLTAADAGYLIIDAVA